MSEPFSVGARIRERRINVGLKQAELADKVGISASYLNLIEHNRRRIAGKLLLSLAEHLAVDPSFLSEGAQASLVARLRECAVYHAVPMGQNDDAADLATRFPSWAQFLIDLDRKVRQLEQTVDGLSDRLAHDPHLATSLHEVLTTVTAIRSTSAILAETDDIEPEWQNRFHRNLSEDSQRLAEEAQALVGYLDAAPQDGTAGGSPWDELENFLMARDYHFLDLETKGADFEPLLASEHLKSRASQELARRFLTMYMADARCLPQDVFRDSIAQYGQDAIAISQALSAPVTTVMRRLAFCPDTWLQAPVGLAACDASGSFFLRKPIAGFHVPRFGNACALWPLFSALQTPMRAIDMRITHTGREGGTFSTLSYADLAPQYGGSHNPIAHSYMIMTPALDTGQQPFRVGAACRVCAIAGCNSRREMSILGEDL